MMISIVTPAYNEEENIIPLYENIKKAMGRRDYETNPNMEYITGCLVT